MITPNHAAKILASFESFAKADSDRTFLKKYSGHIFEVHYNGKSFTYKWGRNEVEKKTALDVVRTFEEETRRR